MLHAYENTCLHAFIYVMYVVCMYVCREIPGVYMSRAYLGIPCQAASVQTTTLDAALAAGKEALLHSSPRYSRCSWEAKPNYQQLSLACFFKPNPLSRPTVGADRDSQKPHEILRIGAVRSGLRGTHACPIKKPAGLPFQRDVLLSKMVILKLHLKALCICMPVCV